jgi:hypothetical protein
MDTIKSVGWTRGGSRTGGRFLFVLIHKGPTQKQSLSLQASSYISQVLFFLILHLSPFLCSPWAAATTMESRFMSAGSRTTLGNERIFTHPLVSRLFSFARGRGTNALPPNLFYDFTSQSDLASLFEPYGRITDSTLEWTCKQFCPCS